jgi:nitrous oxidase accessory protein NosD
VKARVLALALLAAAAAIHLWATVPLQRQAGADGDEYRRLRDQRRQAQSRLDRAQRGENLRRQAAAVFASGGEGDVVRTARQSMLGALEGAEVSKVRLSVRPGRDAVAATVTLVAEGEFQEVVRLSSHLVRAGSGLLLQAVTFSPGPTSVGLQVEALGPRGRS